MRQEVVDDDGTREEQCSSRCRGSRCLRPAPGQPAAQARSGLRLVPACGANLLGGGGSCALALASESAPRQSIGRSCSRVRRPTRPYVRAVRIADTRRAQRNSARHVSCFDVRISPDGPVGLGLASCLLTVVFLWLWGHESLLVGFRAGPPPAESAVSWGHQDIIHILYGRHSVAEVAHSQSHKILYTILTHNRSHTHLPFFFAHSFVF